MNSQPPSPMEFLTVEESADVEKALLLREEKFLTRLTISSLRMLKTIAKDFEVAIEDLTYEQIIEWFEKDSKTRQEKGADAAKLNW